MNCDEKGIKYNLYLFLVTTYFFHLCGSVPPAPLGSRISVHEAQESSLTERGQVKQDVTKGNLNELLVQGSELHGSSKSGYNKFGSRTEAFYADHIPDFSKSKVSEAVPHESLSWTWTKGKAIKSQSLLDTEDGYQSDFTGFSAVPGKVLVSSSDTVPRASEWLALKPVLLCDQNFMSFTASGQGFSQLLVDKGGASPVSLFQLSLYCGYTVRKSWSDLHMVVPYDACYITQENNSYVLPMLWWGNPLKLSCPVRKPMAASSIPVVLCSPYGMAVYLHQRENGLPVLGVLGNGVWSPFVSSECAYRVDSQPEEFIFFIPFVASCLRDGQELKLVFDKQEIMLSCTLSPPPSSLPQSGETLQPHVPYTKNPSTPPPSSVQDPIAELPDFRHATDTGLPYTQIPRLPNPGFQPDIRNRFSPVGAPVAPLHQFPYPSTYQPDAPASSAQDQIVQLPGHPHLAYPGFRYPTFPHVYPPDSKPAIPWFSPGGVPGAPSNALPVAPGFSAQDQIPLRHDYPQFAYPGFRSPTFSSVYLPGSKSAIPPHPSQDSGPGALPHHFQYPKNPLPAPPPTPPTQDQMAQFPYNFHSAYSKFLAPQFPQVYLPASEPAGPSQATAPQAPHPPTILDYLQIPSYPIPAGSMSRPHPPPFSPPKQPAMPHYHLPSNLYSFHNPHEHFFHPQKDHSHLPPSTFANPSYPYPQDPIYLLSPPSEEHHQANCPPYSQTPCGSYQYAYPDSYPPYSPIHTPVSQYPTESPASTQKPLFGKTSINPSVVPKPKVFCSSNQMVVQLPPGPISEIVVKDAKGNEISIQEAPKHCGYSPSIGKNGKIHFSLELHTRCHMSVKDNMYTISVTHMTQSGRMEAQFYCPASASSSGHDCSLPKDQRIPCQQGLVSQASCLSMGCCFSKQPPACYYHMDECTVDRHFVFSVPASLTEPPLSPGQLGVANNSTCKPVKVTSDYALFKLPMDGCGARRMEVGKTLIYMVEVINIVQTISLNYGTITRDSPVRLLVECRYVPGSALTVSYLVKTPTLGPAVQTQGVFGVQLRLAKDAQYTSYYPQYHQPLQMLLGKPLYLEVRMLNAPDPTLRLLVHYCVAYSRSGSSVWVLLYNGCPNPLDPTSQVVQSDPQSHSPDPQTRRFTMTTFQFLSEGDIKDLNEEIYFMCATEFCSTLDGPCVEGCFGQ
ncbi:uncharacterized protein LOC127613305 [Hippocampus zosterae]|uniref:uncharacterized protein LOC127613305 n=1 Tax=Hippocampus zosterae TaxID=109293 RepID=UPI00223CA142|nr:uncharacterized protein LOC127613305 [Hippocampus zosterae]